METQERDRIIAEKLNEGLSLGDVQKLLADEYGINMTYLDLRLVASDLRVDWENQPAKTAPTVAADKADTPESALADAPRATTVTVNKIERPGYMMSGTAEFASGARGEWSIDYSGRPALSLAEGSAKPTQEDLADFQRELQQKLGAQ